VANENNDSLSLRLVLSVLQRKLSDLDGGQKISVSVDLDVVDGIRQLLTVIGLG
jgi:hypothetical protein